LLITGCKSTFNSGLKGGVPLSPTPPKVLYHFTKYADFIQYREGVSGPTEEQWGQINSTGDAYSKNRRGLYGSQHPAYNERYAGGELINETLGNGSWLVEIEVDQSCITGSDQIVPDERWPGSGFWIIRSKDCIRDIKSRPDEVLNIFATVDELWNQKPYVTDKDRFADDGVNGTKVLRSVLIRAFAQVDLSRVSDMKTMLKNITQVAAKSDIPDLKKDLSTLMSLADHCHHSKKFAVYQESLRAIIQQKLVDFRNLGSLPIQSDCRLKPVEDVKASGDFQSESTHLSAEVVATAAYSIGVETAEQTKTRNDQLLGLRKDVEKAANLLGLDFGQKIGLPGDCILEVFIPGVASVSVHESGFGTLRFKKGKILTLECSPIGNQSQEKVASLCKTFLESGINRGVWNKR
ncbi:MAG: hypothetical protein NT027_19480, partial [Proteobacteria bacterium]|nr:hypothetical protein [Pseudomonadota bacterium]